MQTLGYHGKKCLKYVITTCNHYGYSDFIWDFGKLPFPTHLGKYFIKIGKIRAKNMKLGK